MFLCDSGDLKGKSVLNSLARIQRKKIQVYFANVRNWESRLLGLQQGGLLPAGGHTAGELTQVVFHIHSVAILSLLTCEVPHCLAGSLDLESWLTQGSYAAHAVTQPRSNLAS